MTQRQTTTERSYAERLQLADRKKRRRRRKIRRKGVILRVLLLLMAAVCIYRIAGCRDDGKAPVAESAAEGKTHGTRTSMEDWPELDVQLIDVNPYSRPGIALSKVQGIVVHYTANPGSSAKANRDYFANLAETHTTKASSHFVVGMDGEIIQLIPCEEIAYASNNRNSDTLSIECCIPDESGRFTDATYRSLVELVSWLVCRYDLKTEDVIRHYDVTGKICPKYFVENPEAWDAFREDIAAYIKKYSE